MLENAEAQAQVWEKLFPNEQRRNLAKAFIGRVSVIPGIVRIAAMEVGQGKATQQRLFVFSEGEPAIGIPEPEEMAQVLKAWIDICPDDESRALLGYTPVVTEILFEEDRDTLAEIRDKEVVTLWEKATTPSSSS